MASINGVGSSSSISGLYNSANIISGLASGLDTEGMIESLVKSYQNKIQTLNNKATKLGWKQEAYQSIISKAYAFSSKYTSYMSGTNLLAASFFNSAVNVRALGKFADKIAASGRTDSDVKVNSVKQLATSARYSPTAGALKDLGGESYIAAVKGSDWSSDAGLDLAGDQINLGTLHGSLSFTYGSQTVSISFDEVSDYGKITGTTAEEKAESLAKLIEDKLADQTVSLTGGTTASAADRIKVDVQDGKLVFSDKSTAKNSVYISGASGTVAGVLGLSSDDLENADEVKPDSITLKDDTDSYTQFSRKETAYQYLSGKNFNVNVDGTTKTLRGPVITKAADGTYTITTATTVKDKYGNVGYAYGDPSKIDTNKYSIVKKGEVVTGVKEDELAQKYTDVLSQAASDAFGKKLTVSNASTDPSKLSLKFEVADGSNLLINADMGEALGIGKVATNYLNTNSTLGELMRGDGSMWDQMTPNKDGKYDFVLNGVTIGSYDKDTKLSTIISDINANSDANVNVSYSKTTREFVFTSKDTGSENGITLGKGLASALFGGGAGAAAAQKTPKELLGANTVVGEKVSLKIDGKEYGFELTKDDSSMERVLNTLNGPKGGLNAAGYTAKFSDIDGSLIVTDKDGKAVNVEYGNSFTSKLMDRMDEENAKASMEANGGYQAGQDATFIITVNGATKEMTRGSNKVEIDGMTINLKGTFNQDMTVEEAAKDTDPVTFERTTDSDKIVDAVKSMINDYNEMMAEIRSQYATMPPQSSDGAFKDYEPLTDEERAGMSESAIQNYEAKAKQGLLFGDSNLSNMYSRLRSAFQPTGVDANTLSKMGITTSYASDGSMAISLNESKLREMLDNDPDAVTDLFTKEGGIMQNMKTQLDRYAGIDGSVKGILVQQAGTPLRSATLLSNAWQKQMDSIGSEIERWQDKLTSQVDRYTSMFSRLEVLINQMNSQSSTLAGLMSGG